MDLPGTENPTNY